MNYAVTFTNNYGRVSVVIDDASSPEDAIKQAIEANLVQVYTAIETSIVVSKEDGRAKAFNLMSQAKALFV